MLKITPDVLLFPFRRGVDIFMVGLPISIRKQITYSTKWVIKLLRDKYRRIELPHTLELLINAIYDTGLAIEKKKKIYLEASQNRYNIKYFR